MPTSANEFNPDAYLSSEEFNPDEYVAETSEANFSPAAYVAEESSDDSILGKVKAAGSAIKNWNDDRIEKIDSGKANTGFVDKAKIDAIAKKYNVSAETLNSVASLGFGGNVIDSQNTDISEEIKAGLQSAVGTAGQIVAGDIPAFIFKKMQDDPNLRNAIDEVGQEVFEQKNKAQLATEMLGGFLTGSTVAKGLGAAGKVAGASEKAINIAKGVTGLTGATALGLAGSSEGHEILGSALGFGFGVVGESLLPALLKGKKPIKQAEKQVLEEAAQELDVDSKLIEHEVDKVMMQEKPAQEIREAMLSPEGQAMIKDKNTYKQLSPEALNVLGKDADDAAKNLTQDVTDFAKYLDDAGAPKNIDEAFARINTKIAQDGDEYVLREMNRFRKGQVTSKLMDTLVDANAPTKYAESFFTRMKDGLFDFYTYVAPQMDKRLGTNVQGLLDDASAAKNKLSMLLNTKYKAGLDLAKEAKKVGLDNDTLYHVLDNAGAIEQLAPPQKAVAQAYVDAFEKSRIQANALGLPITKVKSGAYVPHSLMDLPKAIVALETRAKELGIKGGLTQEEFNNLRSNEAFQELLKGVEIMSGGRSPANAQSFNKLFLDSTKAGIANQKASTIAAAALMRSGEIPEFIKEKDVTKLYMGWNHNTFRHALMRDVISDMRRIRNMAVAVEDTRTATYLTNWMSDVTGGARENSIKAAMQLHKNQAELYLQRLALDETKSAPAKALAKFLVQDAPDFMSTLMRQIYPNVLGLSIKALVPNIVQPLAVGIPELGTRYGIAKLGKAYVNVINTLRNGVEIVVSPELAAEMGLQVGQKLKTNDLSTILKNMGQLASQPPLEALQAMRGGIAASAPYKMTEKAIDELGQISMALYEKSEILNRAVMWHVGQEMSQELMNGSSKAWDAIGGMSPGLKRSIRESIAMNDSKRVKEQLTKYLMSKVVFNYNKETLSAFGRFMGPLFSVFTKWPTAIAGDVFNILDSTGKRSGAPEIAKKYIAPLVALWTLDKVLLPGQDESDVQKVTVGSGLSRLATAGNVMSIMKGDIIQPPALQVPKNAIVMITKMMDNPEAAQETLAKTTGEMARTFMPGAVFLNFLSQDLPTLAPIVTGGLVSPRPLEREGDFFDKTKAGLGRVESQVREGFTKINNYLHQTGK